MLSVNLWKETSLRILFVGSLVLFTTLSFCQTSIDFTQSLSPSTIAPNGSSILTYSITNNTQTPRPNVAFTDILTAGLSIEGGIISNTCIAMAEVVNGNEVHLSGGRLGGGESCEVSVSITATTAGSYLNTSGNITYAGGSAGTSSATLEVVSDRPSFTKSFAPENIPYGGRTTLTFDITNSTGVDVFRFNFLDAMPSGMVVADPPNIQSTCPTGLTAIAGSSLISYNALSPIEILNDGQSCSISVDVIGQRRGALLNVTSEFTSQTAPFGSQLVSSGSATAILEVSNEPDLIFSKSFNDDPYLPGSVGLLEFKITNNDRNNAIDNLVFSDDIANMLSGLVATGGAQNDVCGIGSSLSTGGTISFSGGSLEADESCTFSVPLSIPATATNGQYGNTTSTLTGIKYEYEVLFDTIITSMDTTIVSSIDTIILNIVSEPATDAMFVELSPVLATSFIPAVISSGQTTMLNYNLTNPSSTDTLKDISFSNAFPIIFQTAGNIPVNGTCNTSSSFTFAPFVPVTSGNGIPSMLTIADVELGPGASCNFSIDLSAITGAVSGNYENETSTIAATLNGSQVVGRPALSEITVAGAPNISKSFSSQNVVPGGSVDLTFSISTTDDNSGLSVDDITFTDDLNSFIVGAVASGATTDVCGPGSVLDLSNNAIVLSGGSLSATNSCDFTVSIVIPSGTTSDTYTNTTSEITANIGGAAVTGDGASADLNVSNIIFTKEFINDPVFAGDQVTLELNIKNGSTAEIDQLLFTDNLSDVISGLVASSFTNTCGGTITGTNFLLFSGGSVLAGDSCSITALLTIPANTSPNTYSNNTSNLTSNNLVVATPANDDLVVLEIEALGFSKSMSPSTLLPGEATTLTFDISNSNPISATGLSFTDDINAFVPGGQVVSVSGSCGAGSWTNQGGVLTLLNGTLDAGGTCQFSAVVSIPQNTIPEVYINNTSLLNAMIGGAPIQSPQATASIEVYDESRLPCQSSLSCVSDILVNTEAGQCGAIVSFDPPTDIFECPNVVITQIEGLPSTSFFSTGIATISFESRDIITDYRATCSFTITVIDNESPSISCPANQSVLTDPGQCGAVVSYTTPVGTDNCPGANTVLLAGLGSGASFPVGSSTETYEVSDAEGQTHSCSFTVTVTDGEKPTIICPLDVVVCEGEAINLGNATVGDNCDTNPAFGNDAPATFPIGVTTAVTWTVTDAAGNAETCMQNVTVHANPTVTIASSELPEFCQGAGLILTATASGAGTFLWSTNETSESIEVNSSDTYDITFTDGNGCTAMEQIIVAITPEDLLSAYTIISTSKEVTLKDNTVLNGGVGVMDAGEEAKFESGSDLSSATTFVKASSIDISGGSNLANQIIGVPSIAIPPFKPNTSGGGPDVKIKKNEIVQLDGSVYGKIEIDKEAEVTFTSSDISIEDLKVKKDVVIKFSQCAEVKVKKDLDIEKDVTINPDNESVIFYAETADIKGGAFIQADIYTSKDIKAAGTSNSQTFMIGQFIGEKINGDKDVVWDWNTNCTCDVSSQFLSKDDPLNQKLRANVVLTNYDAHSDPNPFSSSFRLYGTLLSSNKTVRIMIVNAQQQLVLKKDFSGDSFDEQIDASEWTNGVYFVSFVSQDAIKTIKVFKVD